MIVRPSAEELLQETAGKTHLNEEAEANRLGVDRNRVEAQLSALIGQKIGNVEVSGQGGFVVVAVKGAGWDLGPRPAARDAARRRRYVYDFGASGSVARHCPPGKTPLDAELPRGEGAWLTASVASTAACSGVGPVGSFAGAGPAPFASDSWYALAQASSPRDFRRLPLCSGRCHRGPGCRQARSG